MVIVKNVLQTTAYDDGQPRDVTIDLNLRNEHYTAVETSAVSCLVIFPFELSLVYITVETYLTFKYLAFLQIFYSMRKSFVTLRMYVMLAYVLNNMNSK